MQQTTESPITLLPGDAIQRQGPGGTMHRGIFAGLDYVGRAWVIHNAKNDCVKWDLLETFAAGQVVRFFRRVAKNPTEQKLVVERAKSRLGEKFDLWAFNCDHFVTYALDGVAASPQLGIAAGALAIAAFASMVFASAKS